MRAGTAVQGAAVSSSGPWGWRGVCARDAGAAGGWLPGACVGVASAGRGDARQEAAGLCAGGIQGADAAAAAACPHLPSRACARLLCCRRMQSRAAAWLRVCDMCVMLPGCVAGVHVRSATELASTVPVSFHHRFEHVCVHLPSPLSPDQACPSQHSSSCCCGRTFHHHHHQLSRLSVECHVLRGAHRARAYVHADQAITVAAARCRMSQVLGGRTGAAGRQLEYKARQGDWLDGLLF